MTDEQIIKALRCCGMRDCGKCPYVGFTKECSNLSILALDLINRLKVQNNKLDRQYQAAKRKILSLCGRLHNASTENTELKQKNRKYINRIEKDIVLPTIFGEQAKIESIKEFAKYIIDKSQNGIIQVSDIPDYVKEMTEAQE